MKPITKIIVLLVIVLSIVVCIAKVYWLLISSLSFSIILISTYYSKHIRNRIITKILYFFSILLVFLVAIAIRVFIVEIYAISSSSMKNTILPKDRVLVNKLSYGPVLPQSPFEIPWINAFYYLNSSNHNKVDSTWWKSRHFKGYSNIRHHDIIVFKLLRNDNQTYIKRCIAIPGDTLLIKESKVFINSIKQEYSENILNSYKLYTSSAIRLQMDLDKMGIYYQKQRNETDRNVYFILVSEDVNGKLRDLPYVDSTKRCNTYRKIDFLSIFSEDFDWSIDNFGPIIIPGKGDKISLNHSNHIKYKELLRNLEKACIEKKEHHYQVNGKIQTDYTFQNNYFFVMGDNRYQSIDSRFFGLIKEDMIIGKSERVLFSTYDDRFQWKRIYKRIQ